MPEPTRARENAEPLNARTRESDEDSKTLCRERGVRRLPSTRRDEERDVCYAVGGSETALKSSSPRRPLSPESSYYLRLARVRASREGESAATATATFTRPRACISVRVREKRRDGGGALGVIATETKQAREREKERGRERCASSREA